MPSGAPLLQGIWPKKPPPKQQGQRRVQWKPAELAEEYEEDEVGDNTMPAGDGTAAAGGNTPFTRPDGPPTPDKTAPEHAWAELAAKKQREQLEELQRQQDKHEDNVKRENSSSSSRCSSSSSSNSSSC